jgi:uncharacterized protein
MPHPAALERRLIHAAKKGRYSTICDMLEKKADINYRNGEKNTALLWAASNGHSECCTLLIEHRADVLAMNNFGRDVLWYATYSNIEWLVVMCMKLGADPLLRDKTNNESAAFRAVRQEKINILNAMLANGLRADRLDKCGDNLACWAASCGNVHALRTLYDIDPTVVNSTIRVYNTPIAYAAEHDHVHCVQFLIDHHASINGHEQAELTPLMVAIMADATATATCLIEHGADVNRATPNKRDTALMYAAHKQNVKIVRLLLKHGARIHQKNLDGRCAADLCQSEEILILLGRVVQVLSVDEHREHDTCVVCHEQCTASDSAQLSCTHQFHARCLLLWVMQQQTCPMCRAKIKKDAAAADEN